MLVLSVASDVWFLLAPNKTPEMARTAAIFGVSCLGLAFGLALSGRGPGRMLIPLVSLLSTLPWLPFLLFY